MCIFYLFTTHTHPLSYEQQVILIIIIVMHKTTLAKSNQLLEPAPAVSHSPRKCCRRACWYPITLDDHWPCSLSPAFIHMYMNIFRATAAPMIITDTKLDVMNWRNSVGETEGESERECMSWKETRSLCRAMALCHRANNMRSPVTVAIPFLEHVLLV